MSIASKTGFITLDSSNQIPVITIDFSKINSVVDETLYKQSLVNTVTAAIYISDSNTYSVIMNVTDIDTKYAYFSNDFVTDLTKTFVTKEYMKPLHTMHVFDAPDWLKKNVNRMCYAFGSMQDKIKFVERI